MSGSVSEFTDAPRCHQSPPRFARPFGEVTGRQLFLRPREIHEAVAAAPPPLWLCRTALAAISDTTSTASSAAGQPSRYRATAARTRRTWSGLPWNVPEYIVAVTVIPASSPVTWPEGKTSSLSGDGLGSVMLRW